MAQISIVVPIYKTGKILERTLIALSKQTFRDIECLLIDDGGNDLKTSQICSYFVQSDNRFKYYSKENEGIEKTRLFGVSKASGSLIAFCDHDDYYDLNALECLYNAYKQSGSDIVIANCYKRMGNMFFLNRQKNHIEITKHTILTKEEYLREDFVLTFFGEHRFSVSTWGKLYKKELFDDPFELYGVNILEDVVLNIQIFDRAEKFHFIHDYVYTHVYGGITSSNNVESALDGYEKVYEFRKKYLCRHNLSLSPLLVEYQNIINQRIEMMIDAGYTEEDFKRVIDKILKYKIYKDLTSFLPDSELRSNIKMLGSDVCLLYKESLSQSTIKRKLKYNIRILYKLFTNFNLSKNARSLS